MGNINDEIVPCLANQLNCETWQILSGVERLQLDAENLEKEKTIHRPPLVSP